MPPETPEPPAKLPEPPMLDRPCPLCGSGDRSRVFAPFNVDFARLDAFAFASRKLPEYMHWRLIECPACDLVYASPLPAGDFLHRAYDAAGYDSAPEARLAARTYAGLAAGLAALLPDRAGAIDVGAGDGAFLAELLALGFTNVAGVEPSAAPIAAAAPAVRPLLRHDIFRPESFAPESVSLITCFQTIEHLPDPLALCRDALRLLKPGGAVLLVAHNRRAASAKILGRRSPIFDIEHLQLFSPAAARELLRRAGFVDPTVRPIWNSYPLHYWLKLFPLPGGVKRSLLPRLRDSAPGRLRIALPAGNMAIIGRKPLTPAGPG